MRVSVVGAGFMGSAAVERLTSAGLEVWVYSRRLERVRELCVRTGCHAASSLRELAERSDVVCVWVSDDRALLDVVWGLGGKEGKVLVVHSTVSTLTSLEAMRVAERLGWSYVEAPVVGGPSTLRSGSALFLVAYRDRGAYEKARGALAPLAKRVLEVGEPPKAMALKLAVNEVFFTAVAGLVEASALAEAYGVREQLYEVLRETWARALVNYYAGRLDREDGEPRFSSANAAKDLLDFAEAARELGLPSHVATAAAQLFIDGAMRGRGLRDYVSVAHELLDHARARRGTLALKPCGSPERRR